MDVESDPGRTPSSHRHNAPHVPWRHVGPAPRAGAMGRLVHRKPYGGPCEHQPFQKLSATPTRARSTLCCYDIHSDELAEMRQHLQNRGSPRPPRCPRGAGGHPSDTAGRRGVVETVKPDGQHQAAGEARVNALHVLIRSQKPEPPRRQPTSRAPQASVTQTLTLHFLPSGSFSV